MNLNSRLNHSKNKEQNYIKKELLNKNITKIVNLILSNKPIAFSNLNYNNNFIHKLQITKKGYSMKDYNLKNYKNSNIKDSQKYLIKDLSKQNIQNKLNNNIKNFCNKMQYKRKNNSFYISNKRKFNENIKYNEVKSTSYQKQKKKIINNRSVNSVSRIKKAKSFCISKNLNISCGSVDIKRMQKKKISICGISGNKAKKINMNLNKINKSKDNNKFYIIKKGKNFSHDIKTKINSYIEQQKKYSQREYTNKDKYFTSLYKKNINNNINISFSHDILKKRKKLRTNNNNNTFANITTANSDKENTNLTTKKNNITTNNSNSNNIHYYTTNFNNSTNITETNNDLYNECKCYKEKKLSKKKIKLPFHPYSKKGELFNHCNVEPKKYLIRNNRSEINIPYNKKNKMPKMKRENSTKNFALFDLKNKKNGIIKIKNNTSRENINNSLIDLYANNSSETLHIRNNICFKNNYLTISSKEKSKDKELCEGIEMNHFRIVSIIQENKKLLMEKEK